jgi:predicted metal-binding protein
MPSTRLWICIACKRPEEPSEPREARCGARLHAALAAAAAASDQVRVEPVECLSVCKRPCTIGFSAPGKWTYVYGDFAPDSADEILAAAALYGETSDGLIPWKQRPAALKRGVVARIPPLRERSDEAP